MGVFFMFKNFIESAKNITKVRILCASALLAALYVALYAAKIPLVNDQLRITFTFIPVALAGWLFGIVPAILVGVTGDVLGCFAFPQGAYFWGYTITAALNGLIFGLVLYKKDETRLFWYVPAKLSGKPLGRLLAIIPGACIGVLYYFVSCYFYPQGAYFWGLISGVIFGFFFYKKDETNFLWCSIISKLLVSLLLNVGLNSYWTTFFVPKAYSVIMWGKLTKNAFMFPIEVWMLYRVLEGLKRAGIQKMYNKQTPRKKA